MLIEKLNLELFTEKLPVYKQFLPIVTKIENSEFQTNIWDIPYTIKQLSYLVHSHYRYYGKFPSVVAGQILEHFPPPSKEHYVLDNFCGSGTTLVEAKLRGIKSYGVDVSWLSYLASNVKTNNVNLVDVKFKLLKIFEEFFCTHKDCKVPENNFVKKWFSDEVARDLFALREILKKLKNDPSRDFLLIAFLSIIRRVSKAFDGEVRPHINKKKRQRDVIQAFSKKVKEMCSNHEDFLNLACEEVEAKCFLSSNLSLPDVMKDNKCYLVISHPPYLNSFNYTPVFSLEFYWGKPFEKYFSEDIENLHLNELIAHPASEKITDKYFNHLRECYKQTYAIQPTGSYLAIVIGDCTRNGELIPVIDKTVKLVEDIGYTLFEINYRTTHYGLGKYAYQHRADYHGDAEKKEGIIIFRKD